MKKISEAIGTKVTAHDLRRTFKAMAIENNIELWKANLLTNHQESGVAIKHYVETSDLKYLRQEINIIGEYTDNIERVRAVLQHPIDDIEPRETLYSENLPTIANQQPELFEGKQCSNNSQNIGSDLDDIILKYIPDLDRFYRGLGGVIDIYFSGNKGHKKNTNRKIIEENYKYLKNDLEFMTLEQAYEGSSPGENPSKEIKIPILKKMILELSPTIYTRNIEICGSIEKLYKQYTTVGKRRRKKNV